MLHLALRHLTLFHDSVLRLALMTHLVDLNELEGRAKAIRWTLSDVSRAAGVARTTGYQVVGHRNPTAKTHQALSGALIAEEIRLRDLLNALHPPGREVAP